MRKRIVKRGNSLTLTLGAEEIKMDNLKAGDILEVNYTKIEPVKPSDSINITFSDRVEIDWLDLTKKVENNGE